MSVSKSKFASPKVVVIGGGLMGLWSAVLLAHEGCSVTVLEENASSTGASWAAAGMLAPASEAGENNQATTILGAFGAHSLGLWAGWAARFEQAGHEVCWRPFGALLCAFDDAGIARLDRTQVAADMLGLKPTRLSTKAARQQEPALSSQVLAALLVAGEASVDPRLVLKALRALLESLGGTMRCGQKVTRIERYNGVLRVLCAGGQQCDTDRVVLAGGFKAGLIEGFDALQAHLHPVKGQMLALAAPDNPLRRVLRDKHTYIVPRGNGRIIIGATSEPGREDDATHRADITNLHVQAAKIVPALGQAECVSHWAGVRPQSGDGLPMIGPLRQLGIFVCCGHHRNGVLQAPASAQMLCDAVMDRPAGPYGDAFLPKRFSSC